MHAEAHIDYSKLQRVFFFRVCGTGMGAAACLLKEKGLHVEGLDIQFSPPMSHYLAKTGIPCHKLSDFDFSELKNFDAVIVGNSVPKNSEHADLLEACGTPLISFPRAIGELVLKDRDVIGVAGTHGKTTTVYFLTQLLDKLQHQACGYLVGGVLPEGPPARLGQGLFVIESDEYDSAYFQKESKFHSYHLNHLILTSLEYDHADIFESLDQIESEFTRLFPGLNGSCIVNSDYSSIQKFIGENLPRDKTVTYGQSRPLTIETDERSTVFSFEWNQENITFETNVFGQQNILNVQACLLFLLSRGFAPDELKQATKNLQMVKRRQEFRGKYLNAVVYDDFAHHPQAIQMTLEAFKSKYPAKSFVVVYEPISATARSDLFQEVYPEVFTSASKVILANARVKTTAKNHRDLDFQQLEKDLRHRGIEATVAESLDDLRGSIDAGLKEIPGEAVLIILSNRNCLGLWESSFVSELK